MSLVVDFISPSELLAQFRRQTTDLTNERLFNDPAHQKKRELWVSATLGLGLEQVGVKSLVRVVAEESDAADCELLVGSNVLRFQITEVQKPGRQRGREYKELHKNPTMMVPYQPQRGMQEGPQWIASAVKDKCCKRYDPKPHLVVYVNFEAEDLDLGEVRRHCIPYKDAFHSLWLLQNHRLIQVWDHEQTQGWAKQWVFFPNLGWRWSS